MLTIRTVSAEYLVAMKLRSGRQYKSDLSDVLGILYAHEKRGSSISMEMIRKAVTDLYGGWSELPESSQAFIENVMKMGNFAELYEQTVSGEKETRELLVQFEQNYPGITRDTNVDTIAGNLQMKSNRASILTKLREKQSSKDEAPQNKQSRSLDDPGR